MFNNPARIQDLIFSDAELLVRPMSVDAIYKKNFHNGVWDIDIYLSSGKVIPVSLDDDIVTDVMKRILGVEVSQNEI